MKQTEDNKKQERIIHIGRIQGNGFKPIYLFLLEKNPTHYHWILFENETEVETEVFGSSIEEAILKANRFFKAKSFRSVNCGFRYTLPERDEHGINALFFQMCESYKSSNGVYFDEILGNNCHVQFASDEAKDLMQKLKKEQRL